MNFDNAVFYLLDEGAGSSVYDSLSNGPTGEIVGTHTNIWSNPGNLTIGASAGTVGDNAIKLRGSYIDDLMRLDNLNGSIVVMYWLRQPQIPTSGSRYVLSYGDIGSNADGAYAIQDMSNYLVYSRRGGATFESCGYSITEPLTSSKNNTWFAYCIEIDVIDGKVVFSSYINGTPQRGIRVFNLEPALPRVDSAGAGIRLLGRAAGVNGSADYLWGGTQVKRMFIGRSSGEHRHNIPTWARQFYENTYTTPEFVVM